MTYTLTVEQFGEVILHREVPAQTDADLWDHVQIAARTVVVSDREGARIKIKDANRQILISVGVLSALSMGPARQAA